MSELPVEILQKIPEPIFEIASVLEASLARISEIIRSLVALFKKAARDKASMDSQDLIGVALMLETVDGDLKIGRKNLEALLKLIAEAGFKRRRRREMNTEPVSRWLWETQIVEQIETLMMYRGETPEEESLLRELIHTAIADARQGGIEEIQNAHYECLTNCYCAICQALRKRLEQQPGEIRSLAGFVHFLLDRFPVPSWDFSGSRSPVIPGPGGRRALNAGRRRDEKKDTNRFGGEG